MTTKKMKKTAEHKAKKKKKTLKFAMLVASCVLGLAVAGFLVFTYTDLLNSPDSGESAARKEKFKAELYFSDSNERFLAPEVRFIPKANSQPAQLTELVNALIEGPKAGLVRTIPEKARLINARVDSTGTAVVNFDSAFIEQHPGGSSSEVATIYSLTNSITHNFPEIKRVKILVDGKEMETLKGHIDARFPFTPNPEIVTKGSAG